MSSPASPPSASATFARRPHLDGLRALAATLVVFFHAGSSGWEGGFIGVDVFFVLSGFLITGVLLAARGRTGMGTFYVRRFQRLLPAALLTLVATAAAWRVFVPPLSRADTGREFVGAALYSSNWLFLHDARDYFKAELDPSPVLHFWSLAVEEQYYLVWPWVLLGILAVARRPLGRLLLVAGLTAVATAWALHIGAVDPVRAHFGTDARAYQLLLGVTVAMALPWLRDRGERVSVLIPACVTLTLLALVFLSTDLVRLEPSRRGLLAALATAGFLAASEVGPRARALGVLRVPFVQLLGRASYPAYLWHWPLVLLLDMWLVIPAEGTARIVTLWVGTQILALATHYAVELPAMRLDLRPRPRQRWALAGGLAASVVIGLSCYAAVRVDQVRPEALGLRLQMDAEGGVLTSVEGPADGPRVLLMGDSHAGQWWPALAEVAERNGWQASVYWMRSCAWPDQKVNTCESRDIGHCEKQLRQRMREELARNEYDLVILGSYSSTICRIDGPEGPVEPGEPLHAEMVAQASMRALDRMHDLGPDIVILEPIPELAESPKHCLTADLDDSACPKQAVERPEAVAVEQAWRGLADATPWLATLDVDQLVCPNGQCSYVLNGRPTRPDRHHIQPFIAKGHAPRFEAALEAAVDMARARVVGSSIECDDASDCTQVLASDAGDAGLR